MALLIAVALASCGSAARTSGAPTSAAASRSPSPSVSITPATAVRVAVIVMENRGYDAVVNLPFVHSLETAATLLTNYHAVSHPSLPNYLALTSGTTWGITDDGYHPLPRRDLGDQLTSAGVPWRAYMESMTGSCLASGGGYAVKHDPFAYYGGACPSQVVPFTQLAPDLQSPSTPRFLWITPNLCDDMHDCSSATGDAWLSRTVPALLHSPGMRNGVLFITWDENEGSAGNQVLTLVLGARSAATPAAPYTHLSLLATIEDLLGIPRLPTTAGAAAIGLH